MFRTVAVLALAGAAVYIVLRLVLGFAGGLLALLFSLAWLLLKVALVVGLVYWLLSVFAPETAAKIRNSVKL
jgi:hypothetical protein